MPTFYDPGADAGEASEALRGLAHASRNFENPQDLYGVLGDLLSGVRSLRQVLDQLATAHINNRARAFDDHGDHAVGSTDARAAADELHQAATFIDQAEERLNAAASAASRVAWHDSPTTEDTPAVRWINVVFMQGEDADEVLDMIDTDGATAGLDHLKNWDFGDETTSAARPTGMLIQKHQRQSRWSVNRPPRSGPATAETPNRAPMGPMYLPRSRAGMMSAMIACDRIMSPPPPRPWKPRQTTSSPNDCANPAPADASVNRPIEKRNGQRRPHRSPNLP